LTPARNYRRIACRGTLLTVLLSFCAAAHGQQINWLTDISEAKAVALKTGKPILYDFTASWCGPCRKMDKEFWPRPDVVELSSQFVCVKVNFDREKVFASKYEIRAIPNVVVTDPWGRGLVGHKGFGPGTDTEILEKIKFLPTDFSSLISAGNALESNDKDIESLHKFAGFYQERKFFWLGNQFYQRLIKLESDPLKRENVLVNVAFNYLRLGEPGNAIERFEILRKEYPQSPQNDLYLYGLILANVSKSERSPKAAVIFSELKRKFPSSKYVALAEEQVTDERSAR
jgi:thiol-disulfide isomerase/thioredoxin